jgi:hypothetical protein
LFSFSNENPEAFRIIERCDHEVCSGSVGFLLGSPFGSEDGDELSSEMLGVTTQKTTLFILTITRT